MAESHYSDKADYLYLRARLLEAKVLLQVVLTDAELNVSTNTGQAIHAWLEDYSSAPQQTPDPTTDKVGP